LKVWRWEGLGQTWRLPKNIIWCYLCINSDTLLMLRNQPHLRGHKCTVTKPRCAGQVRRSFLSTRVVNMWNNLPAHTTYFSSMRKFCASISTRFIYGFNVFVQCVLRIISSMFVDLIIAIATCKWLSALCCSINFNLNLNSNSILSLAENTLR